ncbi:hypothetical protein APHNP_0371 [Anaplasma phagocytophilum str. ApNP]|uniref:Uncharacterized protein n=1 Tax=Anaplasma phagocytophilum str. ApNP TaxID=1359153 RepID=A0A0F3NHX1_ANAPH|nr:hypothetical protein APHNP_0371 [Anaplasma phagocytophilum str. ApNP]
MLTKTIERTRERYVCAQLSTYTYHHLAFVRKLRVEIFHTVMYGISRIYRIAH